jgi:hypothetical protein
MVKYMKNKILQKNIFNKLIVFFVFIFAFSFSSNSEAAQVSVVTSPTTVVGERINVDIFINPDKTSINSIQSVVNFSTEYFEFSGFSTKQSTIPVWVQNPKENKKGEISFSGVIPGGLDRLYDPLNSSNNLIPVVRLFFVSKKEGLAKFSIGETLVLKNDGKGTSVDVSTLSFDTKILKNTNTQNTQSSSEDKNPPDSFSINIIESSLFGRSPRLAVFSAQDPEGGISRYEVSVGSLGFVKAESPFPLPYRLFAYTLTVRAFDYSENFREQQVTISAGASYIAVVPILIAILLIVGFFHYRFYNRVRT